MVKGYHSHPASQHTVHIMLTMKMQAQTVSTYLLQKAPCWPGHDSEKNSFSFQSFLNQQVYILPVFCPTILSNNLASLPPQSHQFWSQTQSCASSHSLTLNIVLPINSELDETFQTLSASQSKFMDENIRDSRLWVNHSCLRVYIFEHHVV